MNVLGKKLEHNERVTFGQREYLKKRYIALGMALYRQCDAIPQLDYTLEVSRQSESCYINISYEKPDGSMEYLEYRIRNHDNSFSGAASPFEKVYYLSLFESWKALRTALIRDLQAQIQEWRKDHVKR